MLTLQFPSSYPFLHSLFSGFIPSSPPKPPLSKSPMNCFQYPFSSDWCISSACCSWWLLLPSKLSSFSSGTLLTPSCPPSLALLSSPFCWLLLCSMTSYQGSWLSRGSVLLTLSCWCLTHSRSFKPHLCISGTLHLLSNTVLSAKSLDLNV